MKKIIYTFLVYCLAFLPVNANAIDNLINKSELGIKSTLSIYVSTTDNKEIYKKNELKLLNPASILKVLTFGTCYKVLGKDYEFKTILYKHGNDLYLKLGADTLLTTDDLAELFKKAKLKIDFSKVSNFYIDDTIFDYSIPYPTGWTQDDIWPHSRSISPYIIDNNFSKIAIKRSSLTSKVDIAQEDEYKLPVINNLQLDLDNSQLQKISIERMYSDKSSIVKFSGYVNKDEIINLPVLKPEVNFDIKLRKALAKNSITYIKKITAKKIPKNASEIGYVSHKIEDISKKILYDSDNFSSEVLFRASASKYLDYSKSATNQDAIEMFYKINDMVSKDDIKIVDASGVSRHNLISSKAGVELFNKYIKETEILDLMPTPSQGTLNTRLSFLKDNLKAKTGTLSNFSSFLGTLKTIKNRQLVFCIIIQNSIKRNAILKSFENDFVTTLYRKY